jgi:hypothetical protein
MRSHGTPTVRVRSCVAACGCVWLCVVVCVLVCVTVHDCARLNACAGMGGGGALAGVRELACLPSPRARLVCNSDRPRPPEVPRGHSRQLSVHRRVGGGADGVRRCAQFALAMPAPTPRRRPRSSCAHPSRCRVCAGPAWGGYHTPTSRRALPSVAPPSPLHTCTTLCPTPWVCGVRCCVAVCRASLLLLLSGCGRLEGVAAASRA